MIDGLCLLLLLSAPSQLPPPPPPPPPSMPRRDAVPAKKGTAVMKGRVLNAEGRPLRRAQVGLRGAELGDGITVSTGLDGEYEVRELPGGRFTISVSRSGYLPTQYGQRRYGEAGSPLQVEDGKAYDKIDFTLQRAGVISGRITDETGEPVSGVNVWVLQSQYFRGRRRLVPVSGSGRTPTDDTGQYRISGVAPGEYVVSGILRETWMSDEKTPQTLAFAQTYYPGSASAADARRVKVAAGQEASALDFSLAVGRTAAVSGIVLGSDGAPLSSGSVSLTQEISGPTMSSMSNAGSARIDVDGKWKLREVGPGDYILRANGNAAERPTETAILPITVQGVDIEGLTVAADAGGFIAGRVMTDGGAPLPSGTFSVTTGPVSMDPTSVRATPGEDDGTVGGDGSFRRKSASGAVVLRVNGLPRGWAIKSIDAGGRDLFGLPLDVRPGQTIDNIKVEISNRLPLLKGTVTDASGDGAGTVVLFPTDSARWIEAAALVRSARADQTGAYRFEGLRPGDYFIAAVDALEPGQMNDPEFLTALRDRATKVSVGDAELDVNLKVVR